MVFFRSILFSLFVISSTGSFCRAGDIEIGPDGIDSAQLNLDGSGIFIGMVDVARPPKPFFDDISLVSLTLDPVATFDDDQPATPLAAFTGGTVGVDDYDHAMGVASLMIEKDPLVPGVSQNANLLAAGVFNHPSPPISKTCPSNR